MKEEKNFHIIWTEWLECIVYGKGKAMAEQSPSMHVAMAKQ
jgi:hypothetical protein